MIYGKDIMFFQDQVLSHYIALYILNISDIELQILYY